MPPLEITICHKLGSLKAELEIRNLVPVIYEVIGKEEKLQKDGVSSEVYPQPNLAKSSGAYIALQRLSFLEAKKYGTVHPHESPISSERPQSRGL